jgi:hypothetical protein
MKVQTFRPNVVHPQPASPIKGEVRKRMPNHVLSLPPLRGKVRMGGTRNIAKTQTGRSHE